MAERTPPARVLPAQAAAAAVRVLRSPGAVVLVDGRSGAGKSAFATRLAQASGAGVLALDELYPGWDGLDAGAAAAVRALVARRAGVAGRLTGWDWSTGERTDLGVLSPHRALVVEGCGAIRAASRSLADLALWLDLDPTTRRDRALRRDGDAYRPHWRRWARHEARAIARDAPERLADLVVDAR